ncbi:MAG: TetR/AcrR family transcriptional regulator [Alphaproteobacteria bacterium]|jgi:AcrR family transcriptional regulator|nr:TetR/AcrR family transcriptional regulator [Alphaproteobacteria bacterium]MBT4083509.1 TetR/AcrR family transcriptional regulator [Alphaproteobacteria bacterium]MBT4546718.1 TetR/AcrR family transcriptional regulator [Alphaproteobacteria bacterium]MBT7747254.1 TetR/AcrR family transcriptional regulator [Alphaproteobacteria bacterium]
MRTTEESTQAIIESATVFFARFGYGKTTMTEIAEYCDMSVGNLYRFFPGKLDLAAKIVDLATQDSVASLRKVAERKYRSNAARVEALVLAELRETYETMENRPTIEEMGRIIMLKRVEVINRGLAETRKVMTEVLQDGIAAGEFAISKPDFASEMIQAATLKFRYPQLWSRLDLPALEREAKGVIRLLIKGIQKN